MARDVKLDVPAFEKCMADDVMLPMIDADRQRSSRVGTRSTPTFLICDQLIPGNAPLDVMRRTINEALAKAR
jgi:predicted DsbA family dithiol-disulfide isomerase